MAAITGGAGPSNPNRAYMSQLQSDSKAEGEDDPFADPFADVSDVGTPGIQDKRLLI